MMRHVLARVIGLIASLFLLVTAAFFVIRLAPGGPFDEERTILPQVRANLEAAYGLDAPLTTQYARYVSGLLRGDFGPSFKHKDVQVSELLGAGLPVSASSVPRRSCSRCCVACRSASARPCSAPACWTTPPQCSPRS